MGKGTKQLYANQKRDADMLQSGSDYGQALHQTKTTFVMHEWCTTAKLKALDHQCINKASTYSLE